MKKFLRNEALHGILIITFAMILMNGIFRVFSVIIGEGWYISEGVHFGSFVFGVMAGICMCVFHFDKSTS